MVCEIAFKQCYGCGSKHVKRRDERHAGAVLYYEAQCLACGGIVSAPDAEQLESDWISKRWSFAPSGPVKPEQELDALYRAPVPTVADVVEESARIAAENARDFAENEQEKQKGVIDNNMTPLNLRERSEGNFRNRMESLGYQVSGGIDWLELFISEDMGDDWARLEPLFENARQRADELKEGQDVFPVPGSDTVFNVQGWGPRIAGKYKYPYRCFDQHGVIWLFRDNPDANDKVPPLRIRIPGEECLCSDLGVEGLLNHIKRTLAGLRKGQPVQKLKVGRADLCLDIAGMSVEVFKNPHFDHWYATKARSAAGELSAAVDDEKATPIDLDIWKYMQTNAYTFYIGRANVKMRAYDKLVETLRSKNPRKKQAMKKRRWGGKMPKKATRVEFELRRAWFKTQGVDTVEDLIFKRTALVEYLTQKWFRYTTACTVGDKNANRMPTLPEWKTVQEGFQHIYEGGTDFDLTPLEKKEMDVDDMAATAYGTLKSCAKRQGFKPTSYQEMVLYCAKIMTKAAWKRNPEWNPLNQAWDEAEEAALAEELEKLL